MSMLQNDPRLLLFSFKTLTFGEGSIILRMVGIYVEAQGFIIVYSVGSSYKYVTHRPPTVYNANVKILEA